MKITFFDIETSGLNKRSHAITQIAAITVIEGLEVFDEFECKIKFKLENADAEALEVNSYDAETWAQEAIGPAEAAKQFKDYLEAHSDTELVSKRTGRPYSVATLGGHNANTFDLPFLRNWFDRLGFDWVPIELHAVDTYTLALAYRMMTGADLKNLQLETLCEHFGVELANAHDALADVKANVEVAKHLMKAIK